MSQRDPALTVTIPPPPPRVVMVGGRRMTFTDGMIRELPPAEPDLELQRLRAAHEELVALRQLVLIYLGSEEPRTAAGRAQAEVLREACRPAGLQGEGA